MNDNMLDNKIKEKIYSANNEIPDIVKNRINTTLNNLPDKKKNKNKYIACAVATIVITVAMSSNLYVVAKNIPALNSVFKFFGNQNGCENLTEYALKQNKSAEYNGTTVTVNEVIYDGTRLVIGYTVESQKSIKNNVPRFQNTCKINSKPFGFSNSSDGGQYINDKTYAGILNFDTGLEKNIPEKFNFEFTFKCDGDANSKWDFSIVVSQDKVNKKTKVFKPNISKKVNGAEFKINKVKCTPITTEVNFTLFDSNNIFVSEPPYNFILFDDKGLEVSSLSFGVKNEKKEGVYNYSCLYKNTDSIPKYLTLRPVKQLPTPKKGEVYFPKETKKAIDGKFPMEFKQGNIGTLTVTNIQFLKDKTLVHYNVHGTAPFFQQHSLSVQDESGNKYFFKDTKPHCAQQLNKNYDFVEEFPPVDKSKIYAIAVRTLDDVIEVRTDLDIKIPLTN